MKEKVCSRCQQDFVCQAENISACQCNSILLNEATKTYLSKTNYDCLCVSCLSELNQIVPKANQYKRTEIIENLHYYREGNLMVFTEFFHIGKGKCCKSNCRHCAYGYEK